jgi:hypothetical protein
MLAFFAKVRHPNFPLLRFLHKSFSFFFLAALTGW